MLLAVLLLAASPPPLSLSPFMDEEAAARALEAHMTCLGMAAFERREDQREARFVAFDVVDACETEATALRMALADVYSRKPQLLPVGTQPLEAADTYVNEMHGRIEAVIREERERR